VHGEPLTLTPNIEVQAREHAASCESASAAIVLQRAEKERVRVQG